jgi:hypothetical protein
MNTLEPYQQAYAYDTGNNLTNLSHQANSGNWQQTLAIYPNSFTKDVGANVQSVALLFCLVG